MEEKKKYRKTAFQRFMKYRENNLTGREKNNFERELQKDPFAGEAEEGLSSLSPEDIRKDINTLTKRLRSKTSGSRRVIIYRIAASAALLMAVSTMFFLLRRSENIKPVTQPAAIEIARTEPITAPDQSAPAGPEKDKRGEIKVRKSDHIAVNSVKNEINDTAKADLKVAEVTPAPELSNSLAKTDDRVVMVKEDTAKINGQITEKAATEEAVAAGYKKNVADRSVSGVAARPVSTVDKITVDYTSPAPESGKEFFEKYVRDNIRKPAVDTENAVVVLSFIVRINGIPDSIKVVKSPGPPFSDEAIRLLREGPKWKPATANGNQIEEEARVRIEFK